jgi:hypothetical protein
VRSRGRSEAIVGAVTGPGARRLAALVAPAAAALALAGASHEATGPALVRLTDRQVFHGGSTLGSAGTVEVVKVMLYGSGSRAHSIGHGVLTCVHVSGPERSCNGSYVLPRGTIETAGLLRSRLLYTQAVVGGTGLYDNARGSLTVTAKQLKPRRELLLFRLSG